eukprot:7708722-Pyramimonas_sp.AAC.1
MAASLQRRRAAHAALETGHFERAQQSYGGESGGAGPAEGEGWEGDQGAAHDGAERRGAGARSDAGGGGWDRQGRFDGGRGGGGGAAKEGNDKVASEGAVRKRGSGGGSRGVSGG